MKRRHILVTGAAGFIGSSFIHHLLSEGHQVTGMDNMTPNYPLSFKQKNLARLSPARFRLMTADIRNRKQIAQLFASHTFDAVVHLAALTGVRASLTNPLEYHEVNVIGTKNVYELSAQAGVSRFIFSSSSSVYGKGNHLASTESQRRHPRSPYALSKKKAEDALRMLHARYHLPVMILRLFSVYGPYGRPDMAPFLFTQAAFSDQVISQYGDGSSARDYTYIDDVVDALWRAVNASNSFDVVNIGSASPIRLATLIKEIERYSRRKIHLSPQSALNIEATITYANIEKAKNILGWTPRTSFSQGIKKYVSWYQLQGFTKSK